MDPEVEAKKAADAKKQAAIAEVVAEYEAKQRRKKEKRKDKEKDKKEEKAEKDDDDKAEKEKNDKACAMIVSVVTSLTSSRLNLLRLRTKRLQPRRIYLEYTLYIRMPPGVASIPWQCVDWWAATSTRCGLIDYGASRWRRKISSA